MTGGLLELWTAFACYHCCVLLNENTLRVPRSEGAPLPLCRSFGLDANDKYEKLKPGLWSKQYTCVFVEAAAFLGAFRPIYTCYHRDEFTYYLCLLVRLRILTVCPPKHTHQLSDYPICNAPRSPVPSAKDVERENFCRTKMRSARRPDTGCKYKSPITIHYVNTIAATRARQSGRRNHPPL